MARYDLAGIGSVDPSFRTVGSPSLIFASRLYDMDLLLLRHRLPVVYLKKITSQLSGMHENGAMNHSIYS